MSRLFDISKNGACVTRALDAAFRFAGVSYKIPKGIEYSVTLKHYLSSLGLKVITENGTYQFGNQAVFVIYKTGGPNDEHHAVFCSDVCIANGKDLHTIVTGWEQLKWKKLKT